MLSPPRVYLACISPNAGRITSPKDFDISRLEALKLLGLVLSCGGDEGVWGARPEQNIARTVELLNGLALMDSSRDVRRLAQQLHDAAFNGEGAR